MCVVETMIITIDGIKQYHTEQISKEFIKHFAKVGECLSKATPNSALGIDAYLNKIKRNEKSIFLSLCSTHELRKIILSIKQKKKAVGMMLYKAFHKHVLILIAFCV